MHGAEYFFSPRHLQGRPSSLKSLHLHSVPLCRRPLLSGSSSIQQHLVLRHSTFHQDSVYTRFSCYYVKFQEDRNRCFVHYTDATAPRQRRAHSLMLRKDQLTQQASTFFSITVSRKQKYCVPTILIIFAISSPILNQCHSTRVRIPQTGTVPSPSN